jgi:hypothetical protein
MNNETLQDLNFKGRGQIVENVKFKNLKSAANKFMHTAAALIALVVAMTELLTSDTVSKEISYRIAKHNLEKREICVPGDPAYDVSNWESVLTCNAEDNKEATIEIWQSVKEEEEYQARMKAQLEEIIKALE